MGRNTSQLFFDYESTARIRFKKSNCYESPEYPLLYGFITEKLSFTVPKVAVILTQNHAYIPNHIYQDVLIQFYKSIRA